MKQMEKRISALESSGGSAVQVVEKRHGEPTPPYDPAAAELTVVLVRFSEAADDHA